MGMPAHSTWCTCPSPGAGGNWLWAQRTGTGKARLANGRAGFPAKPATMPGGSKVNRGAPCWSGKALPLTSCVCALVPKTMTLVRRYTWALGSVRGCLPSLPRCRKMLRVGGPLAAMWRLPHVLSRAEPSRLSPGLSCIVALLQGWGGEGAKVLFLNFLGQECPTACQGTAELAGGPSCRVLLPASSLAFSRPL